MLLRKCLLVFSSKYETSTLLLEYGFGFGFWHVSFGILIFILCFYFANENKNLKCLSTSKITLLVSDGNTLEPRSILFLCSLPFYSASFL